MSYATEHPTECAYPGCTEKHPAGKWGDIRAHQAGWFQAKDSTQYCPTHVPKWVQEWRKAHKRAAG